MIYNIDPSWDVKLSLYRVVLITMAALAVYSYAWVKFRINRPLFKPYPIKEVMALDNELYFRFHSRKGLDEIDKKANRRKAV